MPRSVHKGCDDFRQTSAGAREHWLAPTLTRRQALMGALGGGLTIWANQALPLGRILEAAEAQAASAPGARVLVSVFLPGGCDLLDTLPPIGAYGQYADLRTGMKLEAPPALGATGLGIHPSLAEGLNGGVKGLFDAGKIGFLPGIDYANPDLSHFHSRHFWETGLVDRARRARLARALAGPPRLAREPAAGADARLDAVAGARVRLRAGRGAHLPERRRARHLGDRRPPGPPDARDLGRA